MLAVSPERAAVIRGLFELAAFVADHPELPVPDVDAMFFCGHGDWESKLAVVDRVGVAVGEKPTEDLAGGCYRVRSLMGPVRVWSSATSAESLAEQTALFSYHGSVRPDGPSGGGPR
jgi:hypothetical protein